MNRLLNTPRKRVVVLALGCWLVTLGLLQVIEVPYVRLAPGPVFNVLGDVQGQPIIGVQGAPTFDTTGQLDMTTVSERGGPYGGLTLAEAFTGWLNPDVEVVPTALLYAPQTTSEQAEQVGADQFTDSQEKARIAALRAIGEPVVTRPWVQEVLPDSPAAGRLQHGDVVLTVDGKSVNEPKQMAQLVQDAGAGVPVRLDVRRDGQDVEATVTTAANPLDPAKGYLGVNLGVLADSPVKVDFHLDDIGGPSAGLVFALGIVDKLTPEDLLGGRMVAGTGTMDYDGAVGPIGGVAQKLAAAEANGADLFLAPRANCPDIRARGDMQVAAVENLEQAVDVLEGRLDPPQCPA